MTDDLFGTGLDEYVRPLVDLVCVNHTSAITEQVIELALLIGFLAGVARETRKQSTIQHILLPSQRANLVGITE